MSAQILRLECTIASSVSAEGETTLGDVRYLHSRRAQSFWKNPCELP